MELMHIFTGPGGYAGSVKAGMMQQRRRGICAICIIHIVEYCAL